MPRIIPDQVSLLEPAYDRIRAAFDWDQCDDRTKGSKLKDAFREDFMKGRPADDWDEFEARAGSWWRSAICQLELAKDR